MLERSLSYQITTAVGHRTETFELVVCNTVNSCLIKTPEHQIAEYM